MEFASSSTNSHTRVNCLFCQTCCSSAFSYPVKKSSSPLIINSTDCPSLCLQIEVIFTVCNLLGLPRSNVIELISTHGNPDEWGMAYCKSCLEVIEKAQVVYMQIQNLQLQFQSLKKTLRYEVYSSYNQDMNCQAGGGNEHEDVKREKASSSIRRAVYLKSLTSSKMEVTTGALKPQLHETDPPVEDDFLDEIFENYENETNSVTNQCEMGVGRVLRSSKARESLISDKKHHFPELPIDIKPSVHNIIDQIAEENIASFLDVKQEIEDNETEDYDCAIGSQEFQEYCFDDYDPNYSPDVKTEADEDESYNEDSSENMDCTDSDQSNFCDVSKVSVKKGSRLLHLQPKSEPSKTKKTTRRRIRGNSSKRKVECSVCKKQIQFGSLIYHMKTHAEMPAYRCRGCHKRFKRKDYWELHEDTHIYNAFKLYKCCFCDTKVQGKVKYLNHLNEAHETLMTNENSASPGVQMAFFCDATDCKDCFIKKEDFISHLEEHWEDGERLECSTCKKCFGNTSNMRKHEENHSRIDETHNCDFCPFSFEHKSDLDAHLAFHRVEFKVVQDNLCQECGKSYETLKRLKNHIYIQHTKNKNSYVEHNVANNSEIQANTIVGQISARKGPKRIRRTFGNGDFICKICGENFFNRLALERHCSALKHFSYQCNQCEKKYLTQKTLHDHSFDHKSETFPCRHCSKAFSKPMNLYKHIRIQHDGHKGKDYAKHECSYCPDRKFIHKTLLNRHVVQNHREMVDPENKLHFCFVCYDSFKSETEVASHRKERHRNRKCNFCGKFFFDAAKLKSHLRTHTGERPFSCQFCAKAFSQDINRIEHERQHTGERPFDCDTCGSKFLTRRILRDHIKKFHPEVQSQIP